MDPELVLQPGDPHAVARAVFPVPRHQHQRKPVGGALRRLEGVGIAREHEVHLRAAVRDVDLLSVDLDPAFGQLAGAGRDAAEVAPRLGLGQVHAALHLARGEARKPGALDLLAAEFLDVVGGAGLEPHHHHQARIGARDHLEEHAHDQRGEPEASIGLVDAERDQPRRSQLVIGGPDVRGRLRAAVGRELGFQVPVLARGALEAGGELCGGLQQRRVGGHLGGDVDCCRRGAARAGSPSRPGGRGTGACRRRSNPSSAAPAESRVDGSLCAPWPVPASRRSHRSSTFLWPRRGSGSSGATPTSSASPSRSAAAVPASSSTKGLPPRTACRTTGTCSRA